MSLTPTMAPGPTGKPLTDLRRAIAVNEENTPGGNQGMFEINSPGHYFLTRDLVIPSATTGIYIIARGVVLDLNGFTIRGEDGTGWGIRTSPSIQPGTITIRNGRVRNLTTGVLLRGSAPILHPMFLFRIERLTVRDCAEDGIRMITGGNLIAHYCVADNNGWNGIIAQHAILENCRACNNLHNGFEILYSYNIRGCVGHDNGRDGFHLSHSNLHQRCVADCIGNNNGHCGFRFRAHAGARVERCLASGNGQAGFLSTFSTLMRHNLSRRHLIEPGFMNGTADTLEGNHSVSNQKGYSRTGTRNTYVRNTASGNAVNWDFAGDAVNPIANAGKSPASDDAPYGAPLGSANARTNYTV